MLGMPLSQTRPGRHGPPQTIENEECAREASESMTFGRQGSILLETIKFGILTSRAIDWYT
eukprot:1161300-Pelagomonas_calceolata.AAC.8